MWTETDGRAAVRARSEGACELGCGRRAQSFGHRKRRAKQGTWSPTNGVDLCGDGTRGCHGLLTSYPAFARAGGWEVDSWADPETVPVYLASREGPMWVLLQFDPDDPAGVSHLRVQVDPDVYGLPEVPVLPWQFVEADRAARRARAEAEAAS